MVLHCYKCKAPHNLDEAPDEGVCQECGGPLVEGDELPGQLKFDFEFHGDYLEYYALDGKSKKGEN